MGQRDGSCCVTGRPKDSGVPGGSLLRVGAVSYLNTKPLIHRFAEVAPAMELVLDLPSRLADRLALGDLDVALIPSIEALQNPGYSIVSDACIACRGPVLSVKLLSRVPMAQIRTLALDEGSRTSAALVQILLRRQHGICPRLTTLPVGAHWVAGGRETDAMLLIGDRAIQSADLRFEHEWDLGEQWCRWTGVPFVFAMWTAREGVDTSQLDRALRQSRDSGLKHLAEIARAEAAAVGLTPAACLAYLSENLHFFLGAAERQGLQLFQRFASELGLIPGGERPPIMGLVN